MLRAITKLCGIVSFQFANGNGLFCWIFINRESGFALIELIKITLIVDNDEATVILRPGVPDAHTIFITKYGPVSQQPFLTNEEYTLFVLELYACCIGGLVEYKRKQLAAVVPKCIGRMTDPGCNCLQFHRRSFNGRFAPKKY